MKRKIYFLMIVFIAAFLLSSCHKSTGNKSEVVIVNNGNLTIAVDAMLRTKIISKKQRTALTENFSWSEYIVTRHYNFKKFILQNDTNYVINDSIGKGKTYLIMGLYKKGRINIEKRLQITVYDRFPDGAVFNTYFINKGERLDLKKWVSNHYNILYSPADTMVWSFQGGTTDERSDWIRPVSNGFYRQNYLGMTATDYGGGIPVTDVWRRDAGIAIGHLNMFPIRVSFPVESDNEVKGIDISIQKNYKKAFVFRSGDTLQLPQTFTAVHTGDCFSSLREFSEIMQRKGIRIPKPNPASFQPIWCAWGYGRNVTVKEIIRTLPMVKKMGFKWVVIDDGYQQAEGDWHVNRKKFPGGDKQMQALVNKIHSYGLKAKIWYSPLIVSPYSKLFKKHPNIILLNKDESPRFITWWNGYYMSPAKKITISTTREDLNMFISEWGFDGVKLDGQDMNCVPPDYSLDNPYEACEKLPDFFKMIYNTVKEQKTNAVVEQCPCGTCMSFYDMPYMNQAVASDPTSSYQIRTKGFVYKALLMNKTAYYGDHVELSDGGDDFASTIGIGGVPGSKFTWPKDNPHPTEGHFLLTPEKQKIWKKWIDIYKQKMLSKADFKGTLYDIGWDIPQTFVFQKKDTMFYSFYAKKWNGKIKLRGLEQNKTYHVLDYVNGKDIVTIKGVKPFINVSFHKYLLIEVYSN
jgi:alpha-galactosidase